MISANHNTLLEQLVNIICARTNNEDKAFFRPAVCYFFAKIASNYRATITSKDLGTMPLNLYACCLAPSGYGKGHSIGIMENYSIHIRENCFVKMISPYYTIRLLGVFTKLIRHCLLTISMPR